jgi:hypothetical protein
MRAITESIKYSESPISLNVTVPTASIFSQRFKRLKQSLIESGMSTDCNISLTAVEDSLPSFRFSRSVNRGFQEVDADYYVNINDDVILGKTALRDSLNRMQADSKIGILGGILYYPEGRIQNAGDGVVLSGTAKYYYTMVMKYHAPFDALRRIRRNKKKGIHRFVLFYDYTNIKETRRGLCGGAYQMITSHAMKSTGGYDENYVMGYEDYDFCLSAMKCGFKVRLEKNVRLIHEHGASGVEYWKLWGDKAKDVLYSKFSPDVIIKLVEANGPLLSLD